MAEFEWHGEEIEALITGDTFEGLLLAAEHLSQVSSSRAPHEEGDLERSATVSDEEAVGLVAVSFDRPYAVVQHEDMTLQHDAGRTPKYLEGPMHEEADVMLAIIAKQAGQALS